MKTSPAMTTREANRKHPIRRTPFHTNAPAVAGTPAPRAADRGTTNNSRMSMSEAIALLTDTTMRSAFHTRGEPRRAARITMITVQGACRDCGIDAQETIGIVARIIVRVASRLDRNVAAVTTGLIQGAVDSATSAGISAETAAAAAADGALLAASDEGWAATASVHLALAPIVTFTMIPGRQPATNTHPAPMAPARQP